MDIQEQGLALLAELQKLYESNPLAWAKSYCKEHFRSKSPKFHNTILQEALNNKYLAIAAPRESAKSTIQTFVRPTHAICFKKKRFIVIVQNTFSKAAGSLDTIKAEIRDNPKIINEYGITLTRDSSGDSIFRHPDGFETRVLCKGAEQIGSVRGEKFGAWRPDLIVGDDMEDDEMCRSVDRRRKFEEDFNDALIPAGDAERCEYVIIGTILHDDSIMAKLVSTDHYKEYVAYKFKALFEMDGVETSLWEEKWSVEKLKQMEKDKPTTFAKEYQNDPVSGLTSKISRADFRYWTIENNRYMLFDDESRVSFSGPLSDCRAAIACDLAWEEKKQSDFSVIMPGFLTPNNDLLIDTYVCKKGMRPNELEEYVFNMEQRLLGLTGTTVYIGFEKAKLEKVAKWFLNQSMRRRNHFLNIKDLEWDGDKTQRIITKLEPRYNQHAIFHRRGMGDYEHQLLRVPSGVHDDLPDAAQGLCQLLKFPKGKRREATQDTQFEKLRKFAINSKAVKKPKAYKFGKKNKRHVIPSKVSPLQ